MNRTSASLAFLLAVVGASWTCAARPDAGPPPIDARGIAGTLVLCGGGPLPADALKAFLAAAGGESARLVVIPTASEDADRDDANLLDLWNDRELASLTLLHTRSRETADREDFVAPLREATAVWFEGGQQSRLAEAYMGTRTEREVMALLERGGAVGGTSAGAAVMSRLMITGGNPQAQVGVGFDLLPDAVIDQHFTQRGRQPRLRAVLDQNPGRWGVGIDEGAALVVRGRWMRVLGESKVTVCLAPSERQPATEFQLKSGAMADMTTYRRAALDRVLPPFPPRACELPQVPRGALFIVGGGAMTRDMIEKFIELAGGPDAPLVVIPTADADPLPVQDRMAQALRRAGAKHVEVLHARGQEEVEAPQFLDALRRAKGIWFGGGRQWRLVDAYAGTTAETLFHEVLRRDGVIGGSSAGASIQAEYLVRGSPLGNTVMMAHGYERGFGFLSGTAIDQHFAQRNRFADLESVIQAFPQLLGIGIDEKAALVVRGPLAEVIGEQNTHFYHAPHDGGDLRHAVVAPGGRYNLVERMVVEPRAAGE